MQQPDLTRNIVDEVMCSTKVMEVVIVVIRSRRKRTTAKVAQKKTKLFFSFTQIKNTWAIFPQ